jgi:hypothetical protein
LALALWPERVLSKCLHDADFTRKVGVLEDSGRVRNLEQLKRRHPPRHSDADLSVLGSFFGRPGDRSNWPQLWVDFHSGALDEEPLARFVYSKRVVARSRDDYGFAVKHDLARWFWLSTRDGPRRLREPAEEQARATKERESLAVKAALHCLLGAADATANNARGQRRRAAAGSGGGR